MGASTERHNARFDLTRQAQDRVAALSHQRATAAQEAGVFDEEIVACGRSPAPRRARACHEGRGVRPDTTVETLAGLRAAFAEGGSITAGNSSPISDGASAVVVTTRRTAEAKGWPVLVTVGASGQTAGPDNSLQAQPARAIERACEKQGIAPSDLDLVEINEAFGAVVARSQVELGLDEAIVNIHGGGIAIGHPIGASGNRLVVHVAHELARRGAGTAAVGLCRRAAGPGAEGSSPVTDAGTSARTHVPSLAWSCVSARAFLRTELQSLRFLRLLTDLRGIGVDPHSASLAVHVDHGADGESHGDRPTHPATGRRAR